MDNFNNFNSGNMNAEDVKKTIADIDEALLRLSEKMASSAPVAVVKHDDNSLAAQKKMLVSAVLILVAMICMVFSSFAYFTASQTTSGNVIATGYASVNFVNLDFSSGGSSGTELNPISFMPGYTQPMKIYAVNDGDVSLYLRARIETVITLDEKFASLTESIDTSLVIFDIDENFWLERDGYYYYSAPLLSGETSPEIFNEILFSTSMGNMYKDSTVKVKIVFEMVQANGNGTNVFEAVGWSTDGEGGTP